MLPAYLSILSTVDQLSMQHEAVSTAMLEHVANQLRTLHKNKTADRANLLAEVQRGRTSLVLLLPLPLLLLTFSSPSGHSRWPS